MIGCCVWEAETASKLLPSVGAIRSSEEKSSPGNTLGRSADVRLFSERGVASDIDGDLLDEFVESGPADADADVWLAFAMYVSWTKVATTKADEQIEEIEVDNAEAKGRPSSQGLT